MWNGLDQRNEMTDEQQQDEEEVEENVTLQIPAHLLCVG